MQNSKALWASCQKYFKQNVDEAEYEKYFSNVTLECFNVSTRTLVLQVPSDFVCQHIESKYLPLLRVAFANTFGKITLHWHVILVNKDSDDTAGTTSTGRGRRAYGTTFEGGVDETSAPDLALEKKKTEAALASENKKTARQEIDSQLNSQQTFRTFVEGDSNKLCRSVGLSIAEHPQGTQFNPMFIFGPSGCGKTHLINAIGLRCKELYPEKRVLYVAARTFQQQFTTASTRNVVNDFIAFYQTIDVLIIDDVQEWVTAPKTQEAFFHIFNHLFRNGRRILLASDRPPVQLETMMDRLVTRFSCGLVAEMERPNVQLCIDILKRKIQRDGLSVPNDVITYIAENANGSVRDLEGVINSLLAYSVFYNCNIDMRLVERIVKRAIKVNNQVLTINDIISTVCSHYEVSEAAVKGRTRKREIVLPRQIIMYLADKLVRMPASRIGRCMGDRDHSTVLHSIQLISQRVRSDKDFKAEMSVLEGKFEIQ